MPKAIPSMISTLGAVGVLIDVFGAGQHFIGGAAVIDLVEVHAVRQK